MSEAALAEVEKTLLHISGARRSAERSRQELTRLEADQHLLDALETCERVLAAEHRRLMQASFFAVPAEQDQLAV